MTPERDPLQVAAVLVATFAPTDAGGTGAARSDASGAADRQSHPAPPGAAQLVPCVDDLNPLPGSAAGCASSQRVSGSDPRGR